MFDQADYIGASFRDRSRALLALYEVVQTSAPVEFAAGLKKDNKTIRDWRAKIAFIGQVKAGKSTFLGALIDRPGFLPSEVNPWTTVVTNLHFGHPDDPVNGGVFHFFSDSAWSRIIEGDEKTRKLAEDLLPGFESDILTQQVEMMRARARKRLGNFYNLLLGKHHSYSAITRDTLERYVCVGPEDDEEKGAVGRYSEITERADIYFPPEIFATPVVLTDTPGVNDPFLVRDEFTCQSLAEADIFIVTLSAHQALTEVDVALLRMIAVDESNVIVVFINRIDELEAPDVDAPRIIADVKTRVAEATRGANVTVVAGSAHWAELALDDGSGDAELERIASRPEVAGYVETLGDATPDASLDTVLDTAAYTARGRIFRASGVPRVREAISAAIEQGAGRAMLRRLRLNLLSTIDMSVPVMRARLAEFASPQAQSSEPSTLASVLMASIDERKKVVADVDQELRERVDASTDELREMLDDAYLSIRRDLDAVLRAFIVDNRDALERAVADGGDAFELDVLALRQKLETRMMESYLGARDDIDGGFLKLQRDVNMIVTPLIGAAPISVGVDDLPNPQVTPVFLATARVFSVALTQEVGWKFWKRSRMTSTQAVERLGRIIRAEIYPSIDNLVSISQLGLAERVNAALDHVGALSGAAMDALKAEKDDVSGDGDEGDLDPGRLAAERSRIVSEVEIKIRDLEAARARLEAMFDDETEAVALAAS